MILKPTIPLAACVAVLSLAGCAEYASVSEKRPEFRPLRSTVSTLISAERCITHAMREEKNKPLESLGELLAAARSAEQQLARDPKDAAARAAYNFAVARVFGSIKQAKLDPWSQPLRVPSSAGEFELTHRPDTREYRNPALYNFTPADQYDFHGKYVAERVLRPGVGAPLVAVGREINKNAAKDFTIPRIYYGVTALIHFEGRRAVVAFEDPLASERVTLRGRGYPLAADFTVPVAVMLAQNDPKKMELARLLRPEEYAETARIARLQPYDPDKTVVLVIHGLMDSPATWVPMLNTLRGDAEIRRKYQFWFYSYPSGYPYPHSAAILRQQLDAVQKRFPLRRKMVVIGHSMGGCISRLLVTDPGENLWMDLAKKPPGQAHLSKESRRILTDALIFRSRPEVGRVVFIAAPLRGSDLASRWMGRFGSMLVKAPTKLLGVGRDAMKLATFQGDDLRLKRIPNSVDTLAPNNRFVKAIQNYPLKSGVPYHVIAGDRGKGGNRDKTKPVMSDGVVPYWSSHLENAQSELVVPSSHSAHQNPEAIAEVRRILKLHE